MRFNYDFDSGLLFWATVYASRIQTAVYKSKIQGPFSQRVYCDKFEKYNYNKYISSKHAPF